MFRFFRVGVAVLGLCLGTFAVSHAEGLQGSRLSVQRVTFLTHDGGRVDWSPQNVIAFDRRSKDGYYDLWTMNPDGSNQTCLTCGKPGAPKKNKGNPAWHPSGQFIVFQGQRDKSSSMVDHLAEPGRGVANDLWIMDAAGNHYWKLVDTDRGWLHVSGVLHPHFSRDGSKLLWGQLVKRDGQLGDWELHVADFSVNFGTPVILNIRTFQPGPVKRFFESHGFTPDGRRILFTAQTGNRSAAECYMDLATGEFSNLTGTADEWNEHGHISPDGKTIIWASSRGLPKGLYGLNLWLMNSDGSDARLAVDFHTRGLPYYTEGIGPGDSSWSPDSRKLVVYSIGDSGETKGDIYLVEFSGAH